MKLESKKNKIDLEKNGGKVRRGEKEKTSKETEMIGKGKKRECDGKEEEVNGRGNERERVNMGREIR